MTHKKGIFVRVNDELREKLNLLSKKTGKSKSDLIRDALEVYSKEEGLMTLKMKGLIKGIKLEELEEVYDLLRLKW